METKDVVTVIALVLAGACALWCFAKLKLSKASRGQALTFRPDPSSLDVLPRIRERGAQQFRLLERLLSAHFFHCSEFGPGLGNRPRFSSRRLRYLAWQFSSLLYF